MSAATSPGTGLAYGLRRVCAAWGMARSSFYAMTSGQHAEPPPAKRRGPKPAISDQALLVADRSRPGGIALGGRGATARSGLGFRVCRDIRVARKRVLRLMRENNLLSPHRCRRRGGNPHDSEIITHAPNLMWAPMAFGCSRWTTAGAGSSPPSSIGTPSVSAGMSARARPLRRPAADLHGACRAVWLDRGRRGSGAGLADGSRLPVSVGPLPPTRSSSGASSVLRLRRRAPDQRRRRAVQSHAEGTDHPWSHLPQHRGAAGCRPRLRRTLQCPVDRRKERLPEPRSSSSGVARRDLNQARPRETNLCPRNRVRYNCLCVPSAERRARSHDAPE